METLKVRYIGKGHTVVKLNGEEKIVLENNTIEIPSTEQNKFLSNGFQIVGGKDESVLNGQIFKLEKEIEDEEIKLKATANQILDKAKKEVAEIKARVETIQKDRKTRLEALQVELKLSQDDKLILEKEKQDKIDKLMTEQKALEGAETEIKETIEKIKTTTIETTVEETKVETPEVETTVEETKVETKKVKTNK